MSRYCVIGAGAAGISALQQLREAGYEVECFEKTDRDAQQDRLARSGHSGQKDHLAVFECETDLIQHKTIIETDRNITELDRGRLDVHTLGWCNVCAVL